MKANIFFKKIITIQKPVQVVDKRSKKNRILRTYLTFVSKLVLLINKIKRGALILHIKKTLKMANITFKFFFLKLISLYIEVILYFQEKFSKKKSGLSSPLREENLADLADLAVFAQNRQIKFPPNLKIIVISQIKFPPNFKIIVIRQIKLKSYAICQTPC